MVQISNWETISKLNRAGGLGADKAFITSNRHFHALIVVGFRVVTGGMGVKVEGFLRAKTLYIKPHYLIFIKLIVKIIFHAPFRRAHLNTISNYNNGGWKNTRSLISWKGSWTSTVKFLWTIAILFNFIFMYCLKFLQVSYNKDVISGYFWNIVLATRTYIIDWTLRCEGCCC